MKRFSARNSIIGRIRRMSWWLMLTLVIPVVISLTTMLVFSSRYNRSIQQMEVIAGLKPIITESVPEAVWNLVSGRETLENTRVDEMIGNIDATLARVMAENSRIELVVAGRTMDTLSQYVDRIRHNIETLEPVVESEEIVEQIRGVAALVESMLNQYITAEINDTAATSKTLNRVVGFSVLAEAALLLSGLWLSGRMRHHTEQIVRQPIEKLESVTARLASGDMQARIPDTDVAELMNLTAQVNVMADNLENTIRQKALDARRLKKAELRTLQAQINPHFLYNTLDAIVWKAEAGDKDEVITLTSALSDFFRISLSSGADWIPIRQERKHLQGYLSIQQTRYRDILRYEIDIAEDINDYYILKLLLQPLVENALYHGIKNKRGGGLIRVTGRREDRTLVFTVRDTGRGMSQETLSALLERMAAGQPTVAAGTGGFGLVNVNLRIRLYYNQPEGLQIQSGPDGTTVTLRVPCKTQEEIAADDESVSGG